MRRHRPEYPPQELLGERSAWAAQWQRCWICGRKGDYWQPLQTHEIASKAIAAGKWACVENYFQTCDTCHRETLSWLPEAAQLGVKSITDSINLNIPLINQLRGRAPNAIDIYEVRQWERFIRAVRGERT